MHRNWGLGSAARIVLAVLAMLIASAAPASAAWRRATSESFEVYGGGFESEIVAMARDLEVFHRLLGQVTGGRVQPTETRLKIYVVPSLSALREVSPGMGESVAGFHASSLGETAAIVLR